METTNSLITIDVTVVRNAGDVIGAVYRLPLGVDRGPYFVAVAHDWYGDNGGQYDPIDAGTYQDPEQAVNEIERRARDAQY